MRTLLLIAALTIGSWSLARAQSAPAAPYAFDVTRDFLTLKDGVRLAVTWYVPRARAPGEKFPVLLEYLPYRKDDSFYQRDYPLYSYFARHGFLMAKVDVRGTGGSEGALPTREYSAQEMADADEIIAQLARHPAGNGNVGMWGISWGGFNSIMVAARRPPALKAIIALHASDDLYHDDVHYIDGIWHLDPYQLEIDHENGLPRTPDYPLDSAYFTDRFERAPWILTNLAEAADGPYWREESLRYFERGLAIPAYMIGGLLDGYRDTPLRIQARATAPVKVEIGPWEHAWPDDGAPGPDYEWRLRACAWWDRWLRGDSTGAAAALLREPRVMLFVRGYNAPDVSARTLAGSWQFTRAMPATPTKRALYPAGDGRLASAAPSSGSRALFYDAGSGPAGGDWGGDRTGDMGADDAGAMTFDGAALDRPLVIAGTPTLSLRVESPAPLTNWIARLEDVAPDGRVSLVTGGAVNGAELESRVSPSRVPPGRIVTARFELRFTTWTFAPGHRVRLAVTNAQFPMLWPTPFPMTTRLHLGAATVLRLPLAPAMTRVPALPPSEPRDSAPDARTLDDGAGTGRRVVTDVLAGTTLVELDDRYGYAIGDRRIHVKEGEAWTVSASDPSKSNFLGVETHAIDLSRRSLLLESRMAVRSDSAWIHVTFTRRISENGRLVRERTWADSARRDFQ